CAGTQSCCSMTIAAQPHPPLSPGSSAPADHSAAIQRQPVLHLEQLTKSFGTHAALDAVSFSVHAGEVFGYIGPNGAGKTTTFRILCGLLSPTAGQAFVGEQDVTRNKDRIKQLVGYLPDNFGVYPTLRVWEYLDFFAAAYKVPK